MSNNLLRRLSVVPLVLAAASSIIAQSLAFDPARMDRSADACDNFYQYANGSWLKATEIPAAYSTWGSFDIVSENNRKALHEILEDASKKTSAAKGSDEQLIGDFYASCMDTDAIEKAGTTPLEPFFKQIDAIRAPADLAPVIAALHRKGVPALFNIYPSADQKDSTINIANAYQGGLSLPNRDYYTKTDDKSVELRQKLIEHIAKMFVLLGDSPERAKAEADSIMKLEMRLALASKTPAELRDPKNYYNKISVADADKLTPGFSWETYAEKLGTPKFTEINIGQPAFFKEAAKTLSEVSIDDWKTYLRWNVLNTYADRLPKKFDDQNFDFYYKTLQGNQEQYPRWRRCTSAVDNAVGEALGQLFVKTNFTPEAKKRMDVLIDNLFAAYRDHIEKVDWMTDATRKQALAKLAAIRRKIGYPDKLRGYAGLTVDRTSYFDNSVRSNEFSIMRNLRDIGKPVDKSRWGMTTPTVNAYYNSNYNEIVFPAGILQPPFFTFKADDAINYGGIGAVIGHELTHGFDDTGSQYDAAGNLNMWWTPEDRKNFEQRADCVTTQFNGYEVEKGLNINGKLTLGENIADLGGLSIAYDAFKKSLEGKPRPAAIDGFTPEQRFFLGWAQAWAENERPEYTRWLTQSDEHSFPMYRVNGPLSNMTEFAQAFACKPGSKMASQKPCKVW